ncbi:hypothetical protein ACSNO4_08325 [Kocuria flava]|uniref:restriction system modified-DNA reader domain-containing protein n=1 Tax=Kocuria flava TaxID=446860 RepID=UPI003F1C92DA
MTSSPRPRRTPTVHTVGLPDLMGAGLIKPGEELISTLRAWPAKASLNADGSINYDGRSYATPSAAAVAVREGRATNGWSMWGVHRRDDVVLLAAVRAEFEAGHSATPASAEGIESAAPDLPEVEDADPDAPDPADVQPAPSPAEDSTEDPGLVTSFGMFWRRDQVDWSKGNRSRILGHQAGNEKEINFAGQIGVYLLHDGARTVYVGRVSKPRMGLRLFEHTKDRLSGRWDRFSWFGLRPVLSKGVLGDPGATFGTDLVVATMEAILIEGLEPPQNRRQGDGMTGQEYQQSVDEQLQERQMMTTMLRLYQGRNEG